MSFDTALAEDALGDHPSQVASTFIDLQSMTMSRGRTGARSTSRTARVSRAACCATLTGTDVVTCYGEHLHKFGRTRDGRGCDPCATIPLGISYATDVYAKLAGENLMPLNAQEFIRIVRHPVIATHRPIIVVGGPGAWQLEKADRLG